MRIGMSSRGDFRKTEKLLKATIGRDYRSILDRYGWIGVQALIANTPKDTGMTSALWDYEIKENKDSISVEWRNYNIIGDVNIAIILQYGHGTRNGGYVVGRDYINPALQPIFDQMAEAAWKEITL